MCSPSWRCCLMFFVWEPSTSQAGCHDKPNKVYEGVVEGCSLAGARLGVSRHSQKCWPSCTSVIEHQGLVPPQASTVPAQTAWTSPACSNASVARDRVTAQLPHSTCSGIKSTCEHPLQAIPHRGAYLKYVEQCRHNITSHEGYSCAADLTVFTDVTFTWPQCTITVPAAADPSRCLAQHHDWHAQVSATFGGILQFDCSFSV
jgi:hypothetical protein